MRQNVSKAVKLAIYIFKCAITGKIKATKTVLIDKELH